AFVIYFPFIKVYDAKLVAEEEEQAAKLEKETAEKTTSGTSSQEKVLKEDKNEKEKDLDGEKDAVEDLVETSTADKEEDIR
ncbi:MAG: hypothetical protein QM632_05930, partial [Micrococcaceae bacterium]